MRVAPDEAVCARNELNFPLRVAKSRDIEVCKVQNVSAERLCGGPCGPVHTLFIALALNRVLTPGLM